MKVLILKSLKSRLLIIGRLWAASSLTSGSNVIIILCVAIIINLVESNTSHQKTVSARGTQFTCFFQDFLVACVFFEFLLILIEPLDFVFQLLLAFLKLLHFFPDIL